MVSQSFLFISVRNDPLISFKNEHHLPLAAPLCLCDSCELLSPVQTSLSAAWTGTGSAQRVPSTSKHTLSLCGILVTSTERMVNRWEEERRQQGDSE